MLSPELGVEWGQNSVEYNDCASEKSEFKSALPQRSVSI
jgi:hypothetical protein